MAGDASSSNHSSHIRPQPTKLLQLEQHIRECEEQEAQDVVELKHVRLHLQVHETKASHKSYHELNRYAVRSRSSGTCACSACTCNHLLLHLQLSAISADIYSMQVEAPRSSTRCVWRGEGGEGGVDGGAKELKQPPAPALAAFRYLSPHIYRIQYLMLLCVFIYLHL